MCVCVCVPATSQYPKQFNPTSHLDIPAPVTTSLELVGERQNMIYKESISRELTRWVGYGEGRRVTMTADYIAMVHREYFPVLHYQQFTTVRVCNSHIVSTPAIYVG